MFTVSRIVDDKPRPLATYRTLPLAVDCAIGASLIGAEPVEVRSEHRVYARYENGKLVGFTASVPA